MPQISFYKVQNFPPAQLAQNAVYYVEDGQIYLTSKTGIPQKMGGAAFLPAPSHSAYVQGTFFMGWEDTGLIRRQSRDSVTTENFQSTNFASDWANKEGLTYGV